MVDFGDIVLGSNFGLYIHWPYCLSICPYCDFVRSVRRSLSDSGWRDGILADLSYACEHEMPNIDGRELVSVFIGGGTPSLSSPDDICEILECVRGLWSCSVDMEVTLEANPTSAESAKFSAFRDAGVNRLSLGIQSLRDSYLSYLGRNYDSVTAREGIEVALSVFDNVSFDLIYARESGEDVCSWLGEVDEICGYGSNHLSLYQLTLESGTPFHRLAASGDLSIMDDDSAADLFERTRDRLLEHGYSAYEISNFSRVGYESRHNLLYWNYGLYCGVGNGAHGRISPDLGIKYASERPRSLRGWSSLVHGDSGERFIGEALDLRRCFSEKLMMGLRLYSGISIASLREESVEHCEKFLCSVGLRLMIESGYILLEGDYVRASHRGLLCLNSVLENLLRDL